MEHERPLFIPVILGTSRKGRMSRHAARLVTDDIARRFFAPGEQQRLFAFTGSEREAAFFRLWTCKEAFLKVTGEGLSRSTRSYEIEMAQSGSRLVWAKGLPEAASRYSVFPLEPGNGYAGGIVAEAQGLTWRRCGWP